jgi:hypothetical protein
MNHRTRIILSIVCLLAFAALSLATPPQAQEQTHYTYISLWAVPRAQWADFEKTREQAKPVFDRFMADGSLVAWGFDAIMVHTEEGYTHVSWFIAPSIAGIMKTLEALRSSSTGAPYTSVTKHSDLLLHTLVHGGKAATMTTGYMRVALYQAKPGEGERFEESFKKYIKPMLDTELTSGTLLMYSLNTESIHTYPPGGYSLMALYTTAEGLDKGAADLAALIKENPAIVASLVLETDMERHRDGVGHVLAYAHK